MWASKYPLERWGSPLPFLYSTLSQISDRTAPDFNYLTAAGSQEWIDVVIRFFLFRGDVVLLSIATHYGACKRYSPTHNLVTTIESSLWWFIDGIMLPSKIWIKLPFWWIPPPFEPRMRIVNFTWRNLIVEEDCCFVAPKCIRVSSCSKPCQLIILTESFPRLVAGSPFSLTLSQREGICDCRIGIDLFQWSLLGRYPLELYLTPHQWIHLVHLHWRSIDHQEAPHCGANFCDSVMSFAILVNYPW
jgi:hypothetical protein